MNEHLFYIAGLLDSGCFITIERDRKNYRAVVVVSRISREILEPILEKFGGYISPYKKGFKLRLRTQNARNLLAAVSPMMKTKKKEIAIIMRLHTTNGQLRNPEEAKMLYECIRGESEWFE